MNTIDINLLGIQNNSSKTILLQQNQEDILDPKIKAISVALISGACSIFILTYGIWFWAFQSTQKANAQIKDIKEKQLLLENKLTRSNKNLTALKENKKIFETEKIIKKQISELALPWSKILNDISYSVPKNIKITSIAKEKGMESPEISIAGVLNNNKLSKSNPLETISFFALNLNGNSQYHSSLTNTSIKNIDYKKESNTYEFSILSDIQKIDNELKQTTKQVKYE